MNCRVIYKTDGTIAVIHPAPKARRQINTSEVLEATEAAQIRLILEESAITMREIANNAAEEDREAAEVVAVLAEAAVGPVIVIPDAIHEADQDFLDRVAEKATKDIEVRNPDGSITIVPHPLKGLPFDDIDPATLPDRKDRDKWRGSKATGLRVDQSVVTLAERRQAVEDALDAELAKPVPNAVTALKLQRRLDKRDF